MIELDKRIIKGKRPLDCFDTKTAKQFLGKEGYFSDYLNVYANISIMKEDVLQSLDEHHNNEHYDGTYIASRVKWNFFLPAEWVKEEKKEPKYRPFSLEEFLYIFSMGNRIDFKKKNDGEVKRAMFTGYITDDERIDDKTPEAVELMLGCFHYSLFSLFEDFELFFDGKWQPFGMIDE